jgi:hypothetical protein
MGTGGPVLVSLFTTFALIRGAVPTVVGTKTVAGPTTQRTYG